jgi:hypothetical protein
MLNKASKSVGYPALFLCKITGQFIDNKHISWLNRASRMTMYMEMRDFCAKI